MNISIIGASSFLANALIPVLSSSNHNLFLYSRTNHVETFPAKWQAYNYPSQLLDYNTLAKSDVIYYCAGAGIQPKHKDNNTQIYELNAFEPIRLLSSLKDLDYSGKVVCFGSYFEIGNHPENRPYTETELATHTNPLPNAYCTAKNLLTRFIHTELRQEDKLPFALQHFVLTNIYGATENSARLIPYIIQSSINGEALSFTSGIQERQYTHINDIASFLSQNILNQTSGIFNLTDDTMISVRSLIEKVLTAVEQELNIKPQASFGTADKRDVSMKYLGLNTSHVQKCFNFEPQISLEEGIKEYIKLYGTN